MRKRCSLSAAHVAWQAFAGHRTRLWHGSRRRFKGAAFFRWKDLPWPSWVIRLLQNGLSFAFEVLLTDIGDEQAAATQALLLEGCGVL